MSVRVRVEFTPAEADALTDLALSHAVASGFFLRGLVHGGRPEPMIAWHALSALLKAAADPVGMERIPLIDLDESQAEEIPH